jgi:hypothetical protein
MNPVIGRRFLNKEKIGVLRNLQPKIPVLKNIQGFIKPAAITRKRCPEPCWKNLEKHRNGVASQLSKVPAQCSQLIPRLEHGP